MKWVYRLSSLVILGAALSLPFYADYRSGGAFLELSKIPEKVISAFSSSKAKLTTEDRDQPSLSGSSTQSPLNSIQPANPESTDGKVTYYRWQDEQGQWHFSDQAPEVDSEKAELDPNALSTISGMDQAVIDSTMVNAASKSQSQSSPPRFTDTQPSLDNLSNVMENAQQAANMMQERNEALSQIVGE